MSEAEALLKTLISCPSVTPADAGCQKIIGTYLQNMGFNLEPMPFAAVDNLWARRGKEGPLFVFAGHTDVVPPGPLERWSHDPFTPMLKDGRIYGRGAADMKGGLAAMLVAVKNFINKHPTFKPSIAFLLTSDEEGPAEHGTKKVIEVLNARKENIDYCLIGEASSETQAGDQLRIGRRGSLSGKLSIIGKQGHIAFPQLAINPIHIALEALNTLITTPWDPQINPQFPPTSLQISNIHAGNGVNNVIPGQMDLLFNFRFSSSVTPSALKQRVEAILSAQQLNFELAWNLGAEVFLTEKTTLINAACKAIKSHLGIEPILSTGGGTSDGRFIAPTGAEVIELGPSNASVHQIDEHISLSDLETLVVLYERILEQVFFTSDF